MPRLGETTVQVEALKYLCKRYKKFARGGRIFAETEIKTKKKYGSKRADGLIAFKHWIWGVTVIAIEAKSFKTLKAIKPKFKIWKLIWNSLRAGFLISILTGAFFVFYKIEEPTTQILVPLNVFVIGSILYGFITKRNFANYDVPVLDQLNQYPANFQWLAFSGDSLKDLSISKRNNLLTICKHKGIGVVEVLPKNRIKILCKPRKNWRIIGDFLEFYSTEKSIRKEI